MSENRLRLAADLSPEQKTILGLLRELPFVSVADLAKRRELCGWSRASIYNHLQGLFHRDYVDRVEMGWTQKAKRRYFLISKGNTAVERISGKPTEWAETELALRRLSNQRQLLEMSTTSHRVSSALGRCARRGDAHSLWSGGGGSAGDPSQLSGSTT